MLQSGKKWSLLLGSFCAVSAAFADAGADEENGVTYEAEKPSVRPYIMVKGGLPKSGSYKMSGSISVGSIPATIPNAAAGGVYDVPAVLIGKPLPLDIPGNAQECKCGFMGSEELGFKWKWVRLGLELGYMQTNTKVDGLSKLLNLDTPTKVRNYLNAKLGGGFAIPIGVTDVELITALDGIIKAKGYGDSWDALNTKIRFHQPFGAVNLTLDVPLNKYFTAYIGGGLGACYDVGILYLNNQEKLVWRKMKKLYQGFAGIGVNISEGWSLRAGYRLMRIDNKRYTMKKDNQEIGIEGGGTAKGFEVALMYHF